jgi:hypothetical protein
MEITLGPTPVIWCVGESNSPFTTTAGVNPLPDSMTIWLGTANFGVTLRTGIRLAETGGGVELPPNVAIKTAKTIRKVTLDFETITAPPDTCFGHFNSRSSWF